MADVHGDTYLAKTVEGSSPAVGDGGAQRDCAHTREWGAQWRGRPARVVEVEAGHGDGVR